MTVKLNNMNTSTNFRGRTLS